MDLVNLPGSPEKVIRLSPDDQAETGIRYALVGQETAKVLLPLIDTEVAAIRAEGARDDYFKLGYREDPDGGTRQHINRRGVALFGLGRTIRETFGEDLEEPEGGL